MGLIDDAELEEINPISDDLKDTNVS